MRLGAAPLQVLPAPGSLSRGSSREATVSVRPLATTARVSGRSASGTVRSPGVRRESPVAPADERPQVVPVDGVDVDHRGAAELGEAPGDDAQHLVGPGGPALGLDVGVEHEREVVCGAGEIRHPLILLEHLRRQARDGREARYRGPDVSRSAFAQDQQAARSRPGQQRHERQTHQVGAAGKEHPLLRW